MNKDDVKRTQSSKLPAPKLTAQTGIKSARGSGIGGGSSAKPGGLGTLKT